MGRNYWAKGSQTQFAERRRNFKQYSTSTRLLSKASDQIKNFLYQDFLELHSTTTK